MSQINLVVLFGGKSSEHEVSVISANQVINVLQGMGKYNLIPVYVTKDGDWYTGEALLDLKNYANLSNLLKQSHPLTFSFKENTLIYKPSGFFKKEVQLKVDIAFPVFHGKHGEDGCMQGFFELMDVPYVGSNVLASSISMDKILTKFVLMQMNIPTLDFHWFYAENWLRDKQAILDAIQKKFNFPLIIKPSDLGSSIGISKANNEQELETAIEEACVYASRILVEPALNQMREVNCSISGDAIDMQVSACEEPKGNDAILSFKDKYQSSGTKNSKGMSGTQRQIPALITAEQQATIESYGKQTYSAFDLAGLVRIDFMIDERDGKIYVNEINTIPGSLAFYLWEHIDVPFDQLIQGLIKTALKKHRNKQNLNYTFEANLLKGYGRGSKTGGKLKT